MINIVKLSNDQLFEAKKTHVLELHAIADGTTKPVENDPTVVICVDEFGPLNLQPHPGTHWASAATAKGNTPPPRRRRTRATFNCPRGVRHMRVPMTWPPTGSTDMS